MSEESGSADEKGDPGAVKEIGRVVKAFVSLAPGTAITQ